ncbi:hypothetical protein T484DRAFT_1907213, partial [Baffinella frigidus]
MPGSTRANGFTRVSATTSLHIPTLSRPGTRPATAPAARPASALPKKPVASARAAERKSAVGVKPPRLGRVPEKTAGAGGGARSQSAGAKKKVRRAVADAEAEEQDRGWPTRPYRAREERDDAVAEQREQIAALAAMLDKSATDNASLHVAVDALKQQLRAATGRPPAPIHPDDSLLDGRGRGRREEGVSIEWLHEQVLEMREQILIHEERHESSEDQAATMRAKLSSASSENTTLRAEVEALRRQQHRQPAPAGPREAGGQGLFQEMEQEFQARIGAFDDALEEMRLTFASDLD